MNKKKLFAAIGVSAMCIMSVIGVAATVINVCDNLIDVAHTTIHCICSMSTNIVKDICNTEDQ